MLCLCMFACGCVLYDGRYSLGCATECRRVYMNMFRLSGFELKARVVCVLCMTGQACLTGYWWQVDVCECECVSVSGGVLRVFGWFGLGIKSGEWFVCL